MVKEQLKETDMAKVSHVTFSFMSPSDMRRASHIQVDASPLYESDSRIPKPHGVLDCRMGVSNQKQMCETCGKNVVECVGHYGFIDLELPVFHIGYFKLTISLLQMICKACSWVLLPTAQKEIFRSRVQQPTLTYLQKKDLRKKIHAACRKVSICPRCGAFNGMVKKCGVLKIVHDKYNRKKKTKGEDKVLEDLVQEFDNAIKANKELKQLLQNHMEVMDPLRVQQLFRLIPSEEVPLLLLNDRPEDLILTRILVSPACIRPSVLSDLKSGTNEDDTTMKMTEIVLLNNSIRLQRSKTGKINLMMEAWDQLQLQVSLLFNSEISGIPPRMQTSSKPTRGFIQRLKGKTGRFRGNLSGKRVDFSGRTVISPDPNMPIDQVAVPLHVAMTITYPERVTPANINAMRQLVLNGANNYPGADIIEFKNGTKKNLRFGNLVNNANELQVGDTVVRHMLDGDVILFNRQPSLHKLSIQAFYVKVMPHRTFRFNECCCNPFNADFDGDEMNIHLPQTEEAKAEAIILMGSKANMVTPKNGEPLIAAIQDFITGAYVMTQKGVFFDRTRALQLATAFLAGKDNHTLAVLPPPAICKPTQLWTGKQIFNLIMRPSQEHAVRVNLQTKNKNYTKNISPLYRQKEALDLCPKDGYVVIHNSELMCGAVDKGILGSGSKNNVFYYMLCNYGQQYAADALARLARLAPFYLTSSGFSIGFGDVNPSLGVLREKSYLLKRGKEVCDEYIQAYKAHRLPTQLGCNEEETLEAMMLKELSKIREDAGQACLQELPKNNSPLIMAVCGSKGSNINISQMIACVGQQAIVGKRVPHGFDACTLPHFVRHAKDAESGGFVENSFHTGLLPSEFFFHTMAGREGLVDTAVKTAETGYMQRRLVKNLEDLCIHYDMSVRTSTGEVIQFEYGTDSLNPAAMEGSSKPMNFLRVWEHIRSITARSCRTEESLSGSQLVAMVEEILSGPTWALSDARFHAFRSDSDSDTVFDAFKDEIRQFVREKAEMITKARERCLKSGASDHFSVKAVLEIEKMTRSQVQAFLDLCLKKYNKAIIEPGEAIGAVTAQSVGEPGTQMTLKTFHFAGVASMNITLGVPRIKEIIDATKNIKTPIIDAALDVSDDKDAALMVKGRIDKTTLGQICESIDRVVHRSKSFIRLRVDFRTIKLSSLEITLPSIKQSILNSKMKLYENEIKIVEGKGLLVTVGERHKGMKKSVYEGDSVTPFLVMDRLMSELENVVVKGMKGVTHAVVCHDEKKSKGDEKRYKVVVEGENLLGVLGTRGVNARETTSNDICMVRRVLGIEAARKTIMEEFTYTLENHGMSIDSRHTMLLADFMTSKGEVLGITRFGLAEMKESVLLLASFEKTSDHLFEAAYFGQQDEIKGVSECIIMGIPMNVGTGMFQLLYRVDQAPIPAARSCLFERKSFHIPEFGAGSFPVA